MILRADLGFREAQHLCRRLRIGEAFQSALLQRIEGDDWNATLAHLLQLMEHTWAIHADILPEEKHAIGVGEIFELYRSYWNADRLGQGDRCALMAHVGTVG